MSARGWLGGGATVALVVVLAWLVAQPRAGTRFALASSSLAGASDEIELAFTSPVDPDRSHLSAADGSGAVVSVGPPYLAAPDRLRQRVHIVRPGGLTVAYHVTSVGGAEVAGSLQFQKPGGATESAPAGHQHGIDPVSAVLLVLDGLVALGVVILLLVRPPEGRVRRDPADSRASRWRVPR